MIRAAIYQPQYFPRLHYINRVLDADVFVLLCRAQYTKALTHHLGDGGTQRHKSYQSHTPIKQHDGLHLLTVPVTGESRTAPIDRVRPDDEKRWRAQHRNTLRTAYGRAPFFDQRFPEVEALLAREHASLAELNTSTLLWALNVLLGLGLSVEELGVPAVNERLTPGGPTRLRRLLTDTETGVERPDGQQTGGVWTAEICRAVGAGEYLYGGTAGAGYMDPQDYAARGVELVQQQWQGRSYPQQFMDRSGFLANLSVLDLLFNVAPREALDILYPGLISTAGDGLASRGR